MIRKRKLKQESKDANSWECSACTFINKNEDFKCIVCETRKGTSTRKPRLTNDIIEQQQFIAKTIPKGEEEKRKRERNSSHGGNKNPTNSLQFKVFANGFEVTITEIKSKTYPLSTPHSPAISNCSSSVLGFLNSDVNQPSPSSSDAASFTNASQSHSNATSDHGSVDPASQPKKRGRKKKAPTETKKEEESGNNQAMSQPQLPSTTLSPVDSIDIPAVYESPPSSVCSTSERLQIVDSQIVPYTQHTSTLDPVGCGDEEPKSIADNGGASVLSEMHATAANF